MKLKDIIIDKNCTQSETQLQICLDYYKETGKLKQKITVDKYNHLVSGIKSYIVLKACDVKETDVTISPYLYFDNISCNYSGKYLVVQVKKNRSNIIDFFEDEKTAVEYGANHWRDYDRKDGIIVCVKRVSRNNKGLEEFMQNYHDEYIQSWIDLEAELAEMRLEEIKIKEYYLEKRKQKNNTYCCKKRKRQNSKIEIEQKAQLL